MGRPRVRDKLLLAAGELLRDQGMSGLTTRAVAKQAGVTEASVFNNFGDKAGLIRALLQEQSDEFAAFNQALQASVVEGLPVWLAGVFVAAQNYFAVVLPLAGPQLSRGRQAEGSNPRDNFMGHAALARRLESLQKQGVVRTSADADAAALLLMGAAMHSALTVTTLGQSALGKRDALVRDVSATLGELLAPDVPLQSPGRGEASAN